MSAQVELSDFPSLDLFYNYGRLPLVFGWANGRIYCTSTDYIKLHVKDKQGHYHCLNPNCGKDLFLIFNDRRLRNFCSLKCENEFQKLFVKVDFWVWFRNRVFIAKGKKCARCNKDLTNSRDWVCDHILPLYIGGKDWWEDYEMTNFQILCINCNVKKTSKDLKKIQRNPFDINLSEFFLTVNSLEGWLK